MCAGPVHTYLPLVQQNDQFTLSLGTIVIHLVHSGGQVTRVKVQTTAGCYGVLCTNPYSMEFGLRPAQTTSSVPEQCTSPKESRVNRHTRGGLISATYKPRTILFVYFSFFLLQLFLFVS